MATYGLTFLQIINRILVRLRESTVASHDSTDYSTHVGQVVNAVKSEIEGAWLWHALRETFSISTTDDTATYALTGSGPKARVVDGWNFTTGQRLEKGTNKNFNAKFFGISTASYQTGSPSMYLTAGLDANYDLSLDVWPVPITGSLDTLKFNVYVPQDDMADNATVALIPQDVLIEEVVARMKVERGDEDAPKPVPGETFIMRDLLSQAIAQDGGHDDTEFDWEVE